MEDADVEAHLARLYEAQLLADLIAWYAFAEGLARVQERVNFPALAARFRCEATTLQRFAHTGWRIRRVEFEKLLGWRDADGKPLTRWRVVELAYTAAESRAALLEKWRSGRPSIVKANERAATKAATLAASEGNGGGGVEG